MFHSLLFRIHNRLPFSLQTETINYGNGSKRHIFSFGPQRNFSFNSKKVCYINRRRHRSRKRFERKFSFVPFHNIPEENCYPWENCFFGNNENRFCFQNRTNNCVFPFNFFNNIFNPFVTQKHSFCFGKSRIKIKIQKTRCRPSWFNRFIFAPPIHTIKFTKLKFNEDSQTNNKETKSNMDHNIRINEKNNPPNNENNNNNNININMENNNNNNQRMNNNNEQRVNSNIQNNKAFDQNNEKSNGKQFIIKWL
ncbi:hypothetical protein M0812_20841 [Anaeramoeba flamelloides]|uniref:Uncharacterized protein n=1 Tax=Anaeramoeba flamelloides TaxID=1746091 RepID=A0AAV7YT50_9EUKA|nr:hypothetical protein M0812_20841 [Anaeramoeba flamelloides]